jgi:lysozyme family protein
MPGFEEALAITLKAEGGYVNDPDDRGGATNFGVTQETYDRFRRNHSMPTKPVKQITQDEVRKVYREYWDAVGADAYEWPLNAIMFDMAVNHGPASAKKLLQRTLRLPEDGRVGPNTLMAVARHDTNSLADSLLWTRVDRYRALSAGNQIKFLPGWLYRVKHLREETGLDQIEPAAYTD